MTKIARSTTMVALLKWERMNQGLIAQLRSFVKRILTFYLWQHSLGCWQRSCCREWAGSIEGIEELLRQVVWFQHFDMFWNLLQSWQYEGEEEEALGTMSEVWYQHLSPKTQTKCPNLKVHPCVQPNSGDDICGCLLDHRPFPCLLCLIRRG